MSTVFRLKQQIFVLKEQLRNAKADVVDKLNTERRQWTQERVELQVGGRWSLPPSAARSVLLVALYVVPLVPIALFVVQNAHAAELARVRLEVASTTDGPPAAITPVGPCRDCVAAAAAAAAVVAERSEWAAEMDRLKV